MDLQQRDDAQQQRDDQLLASAVRFLIDGGEEKAATVLLSCSFNYEEDYDVSEEYLFKIITLTAPRASYDCLAPLNRSDFRDPEFRVSYSSNYQENAFAICDDVAGAFSAVIGNGVDYVVRANLVTVNDQWRQELLALLRGDSVTNQGLLFSPQTPMITWNNLRFRSGAEVRIAEALDRAHVLFLPNCRARLGFSHRENREADFLICHKGKWGILEVDGPSSHPPARKVDDDERARLFKAHGIRLVEHFDAGNCLEDAGGVVKRFLYLLGQ